MKFDGLSTSGNDIRYLEETPEDPDEIILAVADQNSEAFAASPLLEYTFNDISLLLSALNALITASPTDFKARRGEALFPKLVANLSPRIPLPWGSPPPHETLPQGSTQPASGEKKASGLKSMRAIQAKQYAPLPVELNLMPMNVGDAYLGKMGSGFMSANATADFKTSMAFMTAMRNLSMDMLFRITNSWNELVVDCTYQGQNCTEEKYFAPTVNAMYGVCYMFNTEFNTKDEMAGKRISGLTGSSYGLSLQLYLDQDDYMSNVVSESAGIRLAVHANNELPSPDEQGLYLQPNTHTSVALQAVRMLVIGGWMRSKDECDWRAGRVWRVMQVQIYRLPEPYQPSCFSSWNETDYVPRYPFNREIPIGYNVVRDNAENDPQQLWVPDTQLVLKNMRDGGVTKQS
ncbi:unnamed protein product [Darwinula stevensoni]|uniref:Uncharacterized protein n=1 Tax=Darwinula stevensoni TaxID=69355 RepID=A0A7R8X7I4_9CRUS|nr:unnamed protein product [Darwinula stevensoni]CAG0883336.1 unnamed protein product [Darwinula stevensoni]